MRRVFIFFIFLLMAAPVWAQNLTQAAMKDVEAYFTDLHGIVIQVEGKTVLTDLGSWNKVIEGLHLNVFQDGERIVHPITGKVLGIKQSTVGSLTIQEVFPEYSSGVFTGSKLPNLTDQVGLSFPVKIRVLTDNTTEEDDGIIRNILLANSVMSQNNADYDYTLQIQKTRDVLNYQLIQKDGTVIKSDSLARERIASAQASGVTALSRTELPKGRYYSIAIGRVYKNDNNNYLVGAADNGKIYILNIPGFTVAEELKVKFNDLINVELADLDGDGVMEIFATNIHKNKVESKIIRDSGAGLREVSTVPWLFRSIRNPEDGSRRIVVQALGTDGDYSGEILSYVYEGGLYKTAEPIKGTLGKRLFGFSLMAQDSGENIMININKGSQLFLSTFRNIEYTAPGYFGDTFHVLVTNLRETVSATRMDENARTRNIEKRIYVHPRIEIYDTENFAVAQNSLASRVMVDTQVFTTSTVQLFSYKNNIMRTSVQYQNLSPVVADLWVYEDKGEKYIAALTSNNNWIFKIGRSYVTIYGAAE